jgi:hypothetical protein
MKFGGKKGALEHFGRVGTWNLREGGCARILWSSRYAEFEGKSALE